MKGINSFLEKYWKIILIAILLFSFMFHLKYMNVNAAVWWDEADYLSLGKHYGTGTPELAAPWRSRLVPMLWGPFFFFGLGETSIRLLGLLVGVFASFLTFKLGSEMYNKKVGLGAALILVFLPEVTFWLARVSLDIYSMAMWLVIGYCFWMGYVREKSRWHIVATGAVLGAGIFAYESVGFAYPFIFIFLLVTERLKFLRNKKFWIMVAAIVIAMAPMLVYNQVNFGNPYPRVFQMMVSQYAPVSGEPAADVQRPIGEIIFEATQYTRSFHVYLQWPFFIAFLFGLIGFANMFLGFDYVWKNKDENLKKKFYLFIWMLVVLGFFGFVQSTTAFYFEPRFMFALYPVMCLITADGMGRIFSFARKYNREVAVLAVAALFVAGAYYSYDFGAKMVNSKKDSFLQEKQGGLWLKANTAEGEKLFGCGLSVPIIYYSEREMKIYSGNDLEEAKAKILEHRPKYYIVDFFDPGCRPTIPFDNPEIFTPVQAFFLDPNRQQAVYIIFAINYEAL
ncbi:MAG: glycosyltransferase family 39 protein [Candidatus Woesearchaeota archaeon]